MKTKRRGTRAAMFMAGLAVALTANTGVSQADPGIPSDRDAITGHRVNAPISGPANACGSTYAAQGVARAQCDDSGATTAWSQPDHERWGVVRKAAPGQGTGASASPGSTGQVSSGQTAVSPGQTTAGSNSPSTGNRSQSTQTSPEQQKQGGPLTGLLSGLGLDQLGTLTQTLPVNDLTSGLPVGDLLGG